MVAALCALRSVLKGPEEVEIILFVDSAVALGTLLRGASRQSDWNALVGDLWFAAAAVGCTMQAYRVPSALNPADAPTRPDTKGHQIEALRSEGFVETGWEWPRSLPWA